MTDEQKPMQGAGVREAFYRWWSIGAETVGNKGYEDACWQAWQAALAEPVAPAVAEADARDAALWRKWLPYLAQVNRKPFGLTRDCDAALVKKEQS